MSVPNPSERPKAANALPWLPNDHVAPEHATPEDFDEVGIDLWRITFTSLGAFLVSCATCYCVAFYFVRRQEGLQLVVFAATFLVSAALLWQLSRHFLVRGVPIADGKVRTLIECLVVGGWAFGTVVQIILVQFHFEHKFVMDTPGGLTLIIIYFAVFTLSPLYMFMLAWNCVDWSVLRLLTRQFRWTAVMLLSLRVVIVYMWYFASHLGFPLVMSACWSLTV
jgi:hypothetical protein